MTLTLDDRDPSFSYRGSWGQAGVPGNEFDGTATWTSASGATASLTFTGIQITVFGTIPPRGLGFAPLSAYSIDNGSSSLYEGILQFSPQYKQALFRSDNLSPTINHTLTIENLVDGGSLFLDFVDIVTTVPPPLPSNTVLPVPETSVPPITTSAKQTISMNSTIMMSLATVAPTTAPPMLSPSEAPTASEIPNANFITIDDRSPSLIYAGTWIQGGTASELNGSTTWTNTSGSTVSLNFSGTQISAWGTISGIGNGTAPQSNYTIDDGTPTLFVGLLLTDTQYKQPFFQSDTLAFNNHTLQIETLGTGAYYYLDFITVVAPNSTATTASFASSSTTISAHAKYSAIKVVHVGAIVGGVLGGTFFIGIIAVLVIILKRKRDSKNQRVDKFEITLPASPEALQRSESTPPGCADFKQRELPVAERHFADVIDTVPRSASSIILD